MTRRPHKTEAATLLCRTAAHRWGARAARCHDCVGWHTSRVCHTRDGTLHLYKGCDVCEILATFVNLLFFVFLQLAQALHSLAVKPRTRRPARRRCENGDACGLHNPLVWVGVCGVSLFGSHLQQKQHSTKYPAPQRRPARKKHCNRTFPVQQRNFPLARLVRSPPAARADGAVLTRSGNARRARSWEATNTALALCGRRCHGCMRTRARYLPAC